MNKAICLQVRLDEGDRRRLDALAEHYAATSSTVVRLLIKEKFDAVEAQKPPKRSKR